MHSLLSQTIETIKRFWSTRVHELYRRDQETVVSLEELGGTKRQKRFFGSAFFVGGMGAYIPRWVGTIGFCLCFFLSVQYMGAHLLMKTADEKIANGAVFSIVMMWFFYLVCFSLPLYAAHRRLSRLFYDIGGHPRIQELSHKYRYVYTDSDGLRFTNRAPILLLCDAPRLRVDRLIQQKPILAPLTLMSICAIMIFGNLVYMRLLWPFVFNPMQLAFLEYNKIAKKVPLREGQQVLTIGAGSVPHHMRWKRRLGATGHVTALDHIRSVINDSWRMEWVLETIRSLFGKGRRVSTHVHADSEDLPFDDEVFDVVTAVRCYSVDLDECLRVLKPGGTIALSTCGEIMELPRDQENDDRFRRTGDLIIMDKPGRLTEKALPQPQVLASVA